MKKGPEKIMKKVKNNEKNYFIRNIFFEKIRKKLLKKYSRRIFFIIFFEKYFFGKKIRKNC
jgi:hypothetical protein